jgi:hypothetical protein
MNAAALPVRVQHSVDAPPSLELLARLANESAREHLSAGRTSLEAARRAGVYLLEAKRLVGHGRFADFIAEHCEFSHATACRYMRLARKYPGPDKFLTMTNLTIAEALRLAAGEDEPPPPPRDERQDEMFGALEAPVPTDAGSRLLAAGMSIGESETGKRFRLLLRRLDRDKPWKVDPEMLVAELDSETLAMLERVAEALTSWLPGLIAAATRDRAARLTARRRPVGALSAADEAA